MARSVATAARGGLSAPQLRLGCTRFVSRIMNECAIGSMTIEVPANPVCPAATGELSAPVYRR